jgi:hypothetical protein
VLRGYTAAERWVAHLEGGSSVFAKLGTTELTRDWLRSEARFYAELLGCAGRRGFVPALHAFEDHAQRPLLLLEDLSAACWPPPWDARQLERLLAGLREMARSRPLPASLQGFEIDRELLAGWSRVQLDPRPFLSLGLCSQEWLERALPELLRAQAAARLAGEDLVHGDLRSDNLCFAGDRLVLVDWSRPRPRRCGGRSRGAGAEPAARGRTPAGGALAR